MFAEFNLWNWDLAARPGECFRSLLPVVLIATAVLPGLHLALSLLGRRAARPRMPWNLWERLVYLLTLGSVAVLGATAFFAVLRFGALQGWLLFAHMFGAGGLVLVLPLLAITWCEASCFGARGQQGGERGEFAERFFWFPKIMFWILLASGLAVSLSMLLSMLPLFGSDGLQALLDVHRYSGLLAVVATVFHGYSVLLQRVGLR